MSKKSWLLVSFLVLILLALIAFGLQSDYFLARIFKPVDLRVTNTQTYEGLKVTTLCGSVNTPCDFGRVVIGTPILKDVVKLTNTLDSEYKLRLLSIPPYYFYNQERTLHNWPITLAPGEEKIVQIEFNAGFDDRYSETLEIRKDWQTTYPLLTSRQLYGEAHY